MFCFLCISHSFSPQITATSQLVKNIMNSSGHELVRGLSLTHMTEAGCSGFYYLKMWQLFWALSTNESPKWPKLHSSLVLQSKGANPRRTGCALWHLSSCHGSRMKVWNVGEVGGHDSPVNAMWGKEINTLSRNMFYCLWTAPPVIIFTRTHLHVSQNSPLPYKTHSFPLLFFKVLKVLKFF